MREYTEDFYKLNLRAGYVEELAEKAARYVNDLRMDIQEEINMISPRTMEEVSCSSVKENCYCRGLVQEDGCMRR